MNNENEQQTNHSITEENSMLMMQETARRILEQADKAAESMQRHGIKPTRESAVVLARAGGMVQSAASFLAQNIASVAHHADDRIDRAEDGLRELAQVSDDNFQAIVKRINSHEEDIVVLLGATHTILDAIQGLRAAIANLVDSVDKIEEEQK